MAQQFWQQDQTVTPQGAPGPNPPPGFDLVPLTGADPKKVVEGEFARPQSEAELEGQRLRNRQVELEIERERLKNTRGGSAGQESLDQKFADDYAQWRLTGQSDASKALNQLRGTAEALRTQNITGPVIGMLPDWINAYINPESIDRREQVEEVAQRNLRAILGGQFAAKEGEQLVARAYNPKLPEDINRKRVLNLIDQMVEAAESKESASRYFEQNGTLKGWQGKLFTSAEDFDLDRNRDPVGGEGYQEEGPPAVERYFDDRGNVIHEPSSGEAIQGQDTGIIGEKGGSRIVANPEWAGANASVNAMLKAGKSRSEIIGFLKSRAGFSDAELAAILPQVVRLDEWRKRYPQYKGDFKVDVERIEIPNTRWENFSNSDVGVGAASAADAATGFTLDNMAGALGGDAEATRTALDAAQRAHPKSSVAGTVAGGVGAALGAEAGLAAAGMKRGVGRALAADTGYGLVAGAGGTDYAADGSPASVADRAIGAVKGATAAAAGSLAGQSIGKSGRPSRDPYVAKLNEEGLDYTTIGQQYGRSGRIGGILKRTEDRLAGLPLVGDIINARRLEGIRRFNEVTFNRVLKPLGEKIDGRVGEDAVDYAQDRVSQAFQDALNGKSVVADKPFVTQLTGAVGDVMELPRVGGEVADNIRVILEPYMRSGDDLTETITGEAMQQISRELRDLSAGYYTDPLKNRIGKAVSEVEDAIFGMFRRQAPEVLPAYNKAKVAQRRLYTVADAVNKAKNQEGIFMPSQLGQADRAATIKTEGKVSAARGRGQFQELQRAGQEVLPSKIPDSGTTGRIAVPGIALGISATGDATGATGGVLLPMTAILSLAYTRAGQRLLTKPGRGGTGRVAKALGGEKTQRALSATGGATGASLATQQ